MNSVISRANLVSGISTPPMGLTESSEFELIAMLFLL
jgi:hypothetical protein